MVSRVITRTNGNKKVIDFRDNLNLSALDDYAELHGNGGKSHAVKSTIKCCMCDFTKGTGASSVNVSTNLDIDLIYRLKALSEQFLFGSKEYEIDASGLNSLKQATTGLEKISKLISESKPLDKSAVEWVKGKVTDGIKAVSHKSDFSYTQGKVDVYKKDGDKAPVSILTINHQSIRDNGSKSNYPWYIKIQNGIAPVKQQENGSTVYNAKEMSITAQAFINISDADMFRMMQRTTRYIEIWEQSFCIPNVLNGIEKRKRERIEAQNRRG